MTVEEFAAAFSRARVASNVSLRDLAKVGRVRVEDVRAYQDGKALPSKAVFWRLSVAVPRLQALKSSLVELLEQRPPPSRPSVGEGPPTGAGETEEPATGRVEPGPMGFSMYLRSLRVRDGLTQDEVGDLVGVCGQAVSQWESGETTPVLAHWEALREVWPELEITPPNARDIARPIGGPGRPPLADASPPVPMPATMSPHHEGEIMPDIPAPHATLTRADLVEWINAILAVKRHPEVLALLRLAARDGVGVAELVAMLTVDAEGAR